jgi:hypothetical protein
MKPQANPAQSKLARTAQSGRGKTSGLRTPAPIRGSISLLQRYLGNRALQFAAEAGLLQRDHVTDSKDGKREKQPEFAIGQPRDADEWEADRVADQVVRTEDSPAKGGTASPHRSAAPKLSTQAAAFEALGQPLSTATRAFFEPRFGHDFSQVRVHTDARAAEAAGQSSALAFTVGADIFFGKGRYAPETSRGQRLLAHELAHVVQQRESGRTRLQLEPGEVATEQPAETPVDPLLKDVEEWIKTQQPSPASLDPKSEDFALTLRNYISGVTHTGEELTQKPKDKAAAEAWAKKFQDARRIAFMILEAPGGNERVGWAGQIAQDLATAGFAAEALEVAARLPESNQKFVLENLLEHPETITKDQLAQISETLASAYATVPENPVLRRFSGNSGKFAATLGPEKLVSVLAPTLTSYKGSSGYLEALAEILVFYPDGRVAVSEWLWGADKDYLYEILSSPYFEDPDYGGTPVPSPSGPRELTMEGDMPWVYTYKQKYYVNYLVGLGAEHSLKIPAPPDMRLATLRNWLDANTESIGKALAAEYPEQPDRLAETYEEIADIFFFHVDEPDRVPLLDPSGKVGKYPAGMPALMRIKSDCDVLATYCMRLLTSARFEPIGYLAIGPTGNDGAHVVALLRKESQYYIVNNNKITPNTAPTLEDAEKALLADALTVYPNSKPKSTYWVYFDRAEPTGGMSTGFYQDIQSYELDRLKPATQNTRRPEWE